MAETPTPRTDALGEYPESWLIRHPEVLKHRLLCFSLETDLQHLARVTGEALENLISTMEQLDLKEGHCMCGAAPSKYGCCDSHVYVDAGEYIHGKRIEKAKAALSEIQRIKNQTI